MDADYPARKASWEAAERRASTWHIRQVANGKNRAERRRERAREAPARRWVRENTYTKILWKAGA